MQFADFPMEWAEVDDSLEEKIYYIVFDLGRFYCHNYTIKLQNKYFVMIGITYVQCTPAVCACAISKESSQLWVKPIVEEKIRFEKMELSFELHSKFDVYSLPILLMPFQRIIEAERNRMALDVCNSLLPFHRGQLAIVKLQIVNCSLLICNFTQ